MARSAQDHERRAAELRSVARRSSSSVPASSVPVPVDPSAWLSRVRGAGAPRRHNARTIAALTANPGCHRRALLDGAGVDKEQVAGRVGFPAPFGQSRFAITRGNSFEARLKADGGAELLRLLRRTLLDPAGPAAPDAESSETEDADVESSSEAEPSEIESLEAETPEAGPPEAGPPEAGRSEAGRSAAGPAEVGSRESARWLTVDDGPGPPGEGNAEWYERTRSLLLAVAAEPDDPTGADGVFVDHPLLRLEVAGQRIYLEPDVVAARVGGRFHVVEIKSFAVIDGQADPGKVSAAAIQAAVYVLALRELLAEAGRDPRLVSADVVLVCPKDFANEPTAALIDVRRQLLVLRRQLTRMARIDDLRATLPADLTFDLAPDPAGTPTRPPEALAAALRAVPARYAPQCLATCEVARFCRQEAAGTTAALGRTVRDELGGIERIDTVLALAAGEPGESDEPGGPDEPDGDLTEVAARLRDAARLRAEILSVAVARPDR